MVKCELCGLWFEQITGTHLGTIHGVDALEYHGRFPDALLMDTGLREEINQLISRNRPKFLHSEETKERIRQTAKSIPHTEKWNRNMRRACRAFWNSPEGQKVLREKVLTGRDTLEYSKKMSEVRARMWKDPTYQQAQADASCRRPTEPEGILNMWLQKNFPGEWKYTGDGRDGTYIGGRNPDFLNINGRKLVIEMFGSYYHGPEVTDATEEDKIIHYGKYGFGCLILWDDEVYDEEGVVGRVKNFLRR